MNFGEATAAAKSGAKIQRKGWNGKGMWVRYVDLYSDKEFQVREIEPCEGTWLPFLVMKTVGNQLIPWLASQTDVLAEDWEVVS